jgi:hypothetical protein
MRAREDMRCSAAAARHATVRAAPPPEVPAIRDAWRKWLATDFLMGLPVRLLTVLAAVTNDRAAAALELRM